MKNQIEKEKRYAKKELGTFCEQYGFEPLIAPSRKRTKEKKDADRYKNNNRRYHKCRTKENKEESKRINVIDIKKETLFVSNVAKRDTLVNTVTF